MQRTAEFVSPGHPDKICDIVADTLLDKYLEGDTSSRCAIEVLGGHGLIVVNGEVTSASVVDIEAEVKKIVGKYDELDYKVITNIVLQSPEIARGVDTGGAGDQGIMVGYACAETESLMPLEYEFARNLCKEIYEVYPYDGKTQVTVDGGKVICVVASFQNSKTDELLKLVQEKIKSEKYIINPAGEWSQGGFNADTGLSGRKIVIDNYGPRVGAGGGSFSGKDYTKVDRSGAYMARKIAVDYLKKHKAKEVLVHLAYAIGIAEPVMAVAIIDDGKVYPEQSRREVKIDGYDLTPKGIREHLKLSEQKYAPLSTFGHFGRNSTWDELDK